MGDENRPLPPQPICPCSADALRPRLATPYVRQTPNNRTISVRKRVLTVSPAWVRRTSPAAVCRHSDSSHANRFGVLESVSATRWNVVAFRPSRKGVFADSSRTNQKRPTAKTIQARAIAAGKCHRGDLSVWRLPGEPITTYVAWAMDGLGGLLRAARERKRLSTQDVADEIKRLSGGTQVVGARTVRRWENDTYEPNVLAFGLLCQALGLSADELLKRVVQAAKRAA